jgi:uncharacterized membrane protein
MDSDDQLVDLDLVASFKLSFSIFAAVLFVFEPLFCIQFDVQRLKVFIATVLLLIVATTVLLAIRVAIMVIRVWQFPSSLIAFLPRMLS